MSSNINDIDSEIQDMLGSFVSEAFDSLDSNEPLVENLREEINSESVNAIFRVFHTLKGLSGFFDMQIINKVTHQAETLLDIIRKQGKAQSESTITVIYQTFDFLRDLLQRVNAEFTDQSGKDEAEDMILIILDTISKVKGEQDGIEDEQVAESIFEAESSPIAEEKAPEPLKDEIQLELEAEQEMEILLENPEIASQSSEEFGIESLVSENMLEQFLSGAQEFLDLTEKNLLILEKEPERENLVRESFGFIHSLKGNAGFMGLNEIEEISSEIETILDSIRNNQLDIDQNIVTILLSNIEQIRNRVEEISGRLGKSDESAPKVKEHIVEEAVKKEPEIKEISLEKAPVKEEKPKAAPAVKVKAPLQMQTIQRKDIRVETSKIDKLFDLVGELITIESMVTNSSDLIGLELQNFNKSANMLNKITRELQEISMSIRMMPLEGHFNKMKRLVRDVSIKMNKKVNLIVSGQETEMDKNVIDEIADPLVHILRNSIDHGVESPEQRIASGKDEVGNVSLSARYEGNEILIIVEDDGAGISRDIILRKAQEKGILKTPPESLSDKEVFALVFEPGFSTSKTVTDISGRGVGMDVVRKNIEKLRGSVDVSSVEGKGSKFTLRIPLTLAIMESMLIRVGDSKFALPILAIRESFRPNPNSITVTMDGLEVAKVRQEILPIIRIHELLGLESDSEKLHEGILIIIEARERKVCLFADEIVGQQQAVIKGLSDYIGKVPGITGCMILADGGIGLILDIESLIDMAEKPGIITTQVS
ncbi:MAG: chemotaxis protein CheA [Ignavibacteria bacterium]|nr:chemotaxis protein CheA [Ignavibacteria bacterium]